MLNEARQSAVDVTASVPADDYPVLEYIGALAQQLAVMARREGEEPLARLLETAVAMAARPCVGAGRPQSA